MCVCLQSDVDIKLEFVCCVSGSSRTLGPSEHKVSYNHFSYSSSSFTAQLILNQTPRLS